jgi:hypothetical protein
MPASVESTASEQVAEAVRLLLDEAKEQECVERRSEQRFPFFHPATLTYRYRAEEPISVFTREISQSGIGLLHAGPLERGEVAIALQTRGTVVTFRAYILWCRACGPQWHLSGGQLLAMGSPPG